MSQITHKLDENGHYVQIVTPKTLRDVLDANGEDYSRPKRFSSDDEWDVGDPHESQGVRKHTKNN